MAKQTKGDEERNKFSGRDNDIPSKPKITDQFKSVSLSLSLYNVFIKYLDKESVMFEFDHGCDHALSIHVGVDATVPLPKDVAP